MCVSFRAALALLVLFPALSSLAATQSPVVVQRLPPQHLIEPQGALRWRAALRLTSPDAQFGGFSGLHVSQDGTMLLAITDRGHWLQARLYHEADLLVDVGDAHMGVLRSPDGEALGGKPFGDAEALDVSEGSALVSFEVWHRLWRYPLDPRGRPSEIPQVVLGDIDLSGNSNRGLEGLVTLKDSGRILTFSEDLRDDRGHLRGLLIQEDTQTVLPVWLVCEAPFTLADLALLPNGDLLTLERHFSYLSGFTTRLRRVPRDQLEALSAEDVLSGDELGRMPTFIHNLEGLAVRTGANGEILIYVLSDDNFVPFIGTVLYQFVLLE